MQQRLKRAGFATAALLLLLLVMTGANTWRQWAGLTVAPDTPFARARRSAPAAFTKCSPSERAFSPSPSSM